MEISINLHTIREFPLNRLTKQLFAFRSALFLWQFVAATIGLSLFPNPSSTLIFCLKLCFAILHMMRASHERTALSSPCRLNDQNKIHAMTRLLRLQKRTLVHLNFVRFAEHRPRWKSTVNNNRRKHNLAIRRAFCTHCCNVLSSSRLVQKTVVTFSASTYSTTKRRKKTREYFHAR